GGLRHTAIIGAHPTGSMAEDRRKSSPENPGLKVVPKRRTGDKRADGSNAVSPKAGETRAGSQQGATTPPDANAVAAVGENGVDGGSWGIDVPFVRGRGGFCEGSAAILREDQANGRQGTRAVTEAGEGETGGGTGPATRQERGESAERDSGMAVSFRRSRLAERSIRRSPT